MARLAGVGLATVDRVLNERGGVSPATAIRVIEAARRLGIRRMLPSPHARLLRFELVMPELDPSIMTRINAAIEHLITRLGTGIALHRRYLPRTRPQALAAAMATSRCDAMILCGPEIAEVIEAVAAKTSSGVPVITIMSDLPTTPRLSYAGVDHLRAGRSAAFLLHQMVPHDADVIIACDNLDYRFEGERVAGFREAWAEYGRHRDRLTMIERAPTRSPAWQILAEAVEKTVGIKAVYSAGVTAGVVEQGLVAAGRSGQLKVIAHELDDDAKRLLRGGRLTFVLDQNIELQVERAVDRLRSRFGLGADDASAPSVPFRIFVSDNVP